jgi:branched-chain amino acid transport system permease protein
MTTSDFLQALVTAVVTGSLFALLGTGFGLILGVTGRFHFAYATTFVWSVYLAVAAVDAGVPLYLGILLGILAAVAMGVLMEWFLYRPLVERSPQTALLGVFVTSLGLVVAGENIIRLIWPGGGRTLSPGFTVKRISLGGDIGLTSLDAVTIGVGVVLILALWWWLRSSRYGRAIRAVQENPDMARAVGVWPEGIYLVVFSIGSALGAVAAILMTMRGQVLPDAGIDPTFTALVVMFLAGLRSSPLGFALAAFGVAVIQSVSAVWLSPEWTSPITFGILFLYVALVPFMPAIKKRLAALRPARVETLTSKEA